MHVQMHVTEKTRKIETKVQERLQFYLKTTES